MVLAVSQLHTLSLLWVLSVVSGHFGDVLILLIVLLDSLCTIQEMRTAIGNAWFQHIIKSDSV